MKLGDYGITRQTFKVYVEGNKKKISSLLLINKMLLITGGLLQPG